MPVEAEKQAEKLAKAWDALFEKAQQHLIDLGREGLLDSAEYAAWDTVVSLLYEHENEWRDPRVLAGESSSFIDELGDKAYEFEEYLTPPPDEPLDHEERLIALHASIYRQAEAFAKQQLASTTSKKKGVCQCQEGNRTARQAICLKPSQNSKTSSSNSRMMRPR